MTKKEAAALIAIIAATMPNLQDKDLAASAAAWAALMPDVTFNEGKEAVIKLMRERRIATLPLPGEILDTVRQLRPNSTEFPTAFEAWEEVRKKLNSWHPAEWSNPIIGQAVRQTGSWDIIQGTWGVAERFVKIYNILVEREKAKVENPIIRAIADGFDMSRALGISTETEVKQLENKVCKFKPKDDLSAPRKENVAR